MTTQSVVRVQGNGPESTSPSSRRAVLAAAAGGMLALIAQAFGRPLRARAADGDIIHVGDELGATSVTSLTINASDPAVQFANVGSGYGAIVISSGGGRAMLAHSGTDVGVFGRSGVRPLPDLSPPTGSKWAVYGLAYDDENSRGVSGRTIAGTGVHGETETGIGIRAIATTGNGVVASTGSGTAVHGETADGTGVRAIATTGNGVIASTGSGTGVQGEAADGTGVRAIATTGDGLLANSASGYGVAASTAASDKAAVFGLASAGLNTAAATGVQGHSGRSLPTAAPKTGVYGTAFQDSAAAGVYGRSTIGRGVRAEATTGTAVYARADTNGIALHASRGLVRFSTAGLATIVAGTSSVLVTPGFDISATSKVLAVLQGSPGANVVLRYVLRDAVNNRFRIQLTGNAAANTPVAWFVIS